MTKSGPFIAFSHCPDACGNIVDNGLALLGQHALLVD